jgi:surfeit locus 1 family protein
MLKVLFSRKWMLATLLVLIAVGVMIRLGIWQLDRLKQRRVFNAHFLEQAESPTLMLNEKSITQNLNLMEYRQVTVSGVYDHTNETAISNQSWENRAGVHLLTPLKITGTETAVLVDRGWIPLEDYKVGNWDKFSESGLVNISGMIRLSQEQSFGGKPDPTPLPGESLKAWNFVNINAISKQIPYPILKIYIQQSPDPARTELPYRTQPTIEISEGPHLGYAIQWFIFATILGVGYPISVLRETIHSI